MRQPSQTKSHRNGETNLPCRVRGWLSRDPYVDAQGNDAELTQGANLYWYVSNNSVNAVDPLGKEGGAGEVIDQIIEGLKRKFEQKIDSDLDTISSCVEAAKCYKPCVQCITDGINTLENDIDTLETAALLSCFLLENPIAIDICELLAQQAAISVAKSAEKQLEPLAAQCKTLPGQ
jgi:RHS repeat-associated protein